MADKSTQLILDALSRALTDPAGLPLYGTKAAPGLFAASRPAKQAAQRCQDEGHLRLVRSETKGKTVREFYTLSHKGLAHLLNQVQPKQVLEDLVRAVEARQSQIGELVTVARQTQAGLDALKAVAERVLRTVGPADLNELHRQFLANGKSNPADTWLPAALDQLRQWHALGVPEDCPLPELYRRLRPGAGDLSIGRFHDGLRQLHDREQIYLHPWTGPLCEMPEPPFALLVGHEIAYYASIRQG